MHFVGQRSMWLPWRSAARGERLELLRYHGIWGPGVRLLQNLNFGNKAMVLVVCLIVPLGHLIHQDWRQNSQALDRSRQALQGLLPYRQVMLEQDALDDLGSAMFNEEMGVASDMSLDVAVRNEAQAFAALTEGMKAYPALSAQDTEALLAAKAVRQEALNGLRDRSQDVQRHTSTRLNAVVRVTWAMEELRLDVLRSMGLALQDDEAVASLVKGGLETLPPLQREFRWVQGIGTRLFQGGDSSLHQGMRLAERVGIMQRRVDEARRDLRRVTAHGLLDPIESRRVLDELASFVELARRVAHTPGAGSRPDELAGGAGLGVAEFRERAAAAEAAAKSLHTQVLQITEGLLRARDALRQREIGLSLTVIAVGVGAMVYLLVCLTKVVGGGLAELCARVDALANGDLSERPEARGTDEVGQAMTSLSASVRRMASLFEAVTQGVAAVSHASREVAVGNAGLSGRTMDIRRAIAEVSERARSSRDAMNRCGDEVERISEHMRDVRADAHRSRKAMGELQECMRGLQSKSREIGRVLLLVESVAHQTRLLSLNASVEAARAGVAGKGFGVVAQEVRELARRSEAAARKISEIVQSSVAEIEGGGLLTERVGDSVRLTDERLVEVSAIMNGIVHLTHTGRDQSAEVVGITRSVEESAGGNARMVEQLAGASADLRVQGDSLKRSMQHFVFG